MAIKYMRSGVTSLCISKMEIEIILRYHRTPIRMAKMEKVDQIEC